MKLVARDPNVQKLFDKINNFLTKDPRAKYYNTNNYNLLCEQWSEFEALTPKQLEVLKQIVERVCPNE